jgi:hypothetical protein
MGFINRGNSGGGGFIKKTGFITPPQPKTPVVTKPPVPFMAQTLDHNNLPYYGEGFKGYARKVFASIFDPKFFVHNPTEQQAELIERAGEVTEKKLAGWDDWIGKWTGITAEDAGQAAGAIALAIRGTDEEGEVGKKPQATKAIQTGAQYLYRVGATGIKTGLDVLSLVDKGIRKSHATQLAIDDIGDSAQILPDVTPFDDNNRLGAFANLILRSNPITMGYNALRAITAGGSMADKVETVKDYQRGSNMVYTFFWDNAKKEEYLQRLNAGENPDLLVSELENPWVELAGSVFGDPTTYAGVGIIGNFGKASSPIRAFGKTLFNVPWETVGRIPGFTEILGLKNIGRSRLLAAEGEFTKITEPVLEKALLDLEKVVDDNDALKKLQTAVSASADAARKYATEYGVFSPDSSGKAEVMKKTVGTVFNAMTQRFRSVDDIAKTFKAFKDISSTDMNTASRAFSTLKDMYGTLPFSNGGRTAMSFMTRLADEIPIGELVQKHDLPKLTEILDAKLQTTIADFFPSVDDMETAFKGAKTTAREQFLARSYENLRKTRPAVLVANSVSRAILNNKVSKAMSGFFAGAFMGMSPGYAMRNLQSNTVMIWHDLGSAAGLEALTTGLEVMAKSTGKMLLGKFGVKTEWVATVLERETSKIQKMLGSIPTQTFKGVGSGETTGFAFLGVGADIEKVHSAIITRHVVEREMEKLMRYGGIPSLEVVEKMGLPPEVSERLYSLALSNFGDAKAVLNTFRAEQATGFFEPWRYLELDPKFKDTLQRANLLDELENIRQTAPDTATFKTQMDAFVSKIEELAQRTANEPALVSEHNLVADAVVMVEKAFDEGGKQIMSQEELDQFRAVTELYDQVRLQQR